MNPIKTPEPGIYRDIPMAEYLAWDAISSHRLGLLLHKSPAHLHYDIYHPAETGSTDAQVLGTAMHTALLEPDLFISTYAQLPPGDGRTKAVKVAKAEIEALGLVALRQSEWDACRGLLDTARRHPLLRAIHAEKPDREVSLVWRDGLITCKARLDLLAADLFADLKTTEDASPEAFARSVARYSYHRQIAWYRRGLDAHGIGRPAVLIAAERSAPYLIATYCLPDAALEFAKYQIGLAMEQVFQCEYRGTWPGYADNPTELVLPEWSMTLPEQPFTMGGVALEV